MAQLIEFYIPPRFRKPEKWIPLVPRGKVLESPSEARKSA